MVVQDILLFLTRSAFIALSLISIIAYLRYRGAIRRDIALMLTAIALPISLPLIETLLPGQISQLAGTLALLIQPYQMLRLLAYFQNIPKLISRMAILAVIFSSLSIFIAGSDLPEIILFLILAYFVLINGYAMQGFIRRASTTTGVSRRRLQFTAIGSGLFALVFLILGFSIILPELNQITILLLLPVIISSAITFYLGLTPFRWLRQTWQLRELEQFVVQLTETKILTKATDVYAMLCQLAKDATGAQGATILVQQDQEKEWLHVLLQEPTEAILYVDKTVGILHKVDSPIVISLDELSSEEQGFLEIETAKSIYIVPIEGKQHRWGQLLVYLEQGSLFVEDDLNLLKVYTQQVSVLLENIYLLAERAQQTQHLETIVEARTKDIRQRNLYLKLVQDVTVTANEASTLDEPLQHAIQLICSTLGFSLGHIHMPDENETDQLQPGSIWYLDQDGRYEAFREATSAIPLSTQLKKIEQVLRMNTPIWASKLSDDEHFTRAKIAHEVGLETGIFVPMYIGTKIVAVMEFFSDEVLEEDPVLLDLLLQMGTQLGRVLERQRAEQAIQEREARFRSIFEQAAVGIAEVALDGNFRQMNQRFCEIVGYSREEMLALRFQDITYPADLEADLNLVQTLLEGNALHYSLQKRYYHKTGRIVWINLTVSIVRNHADQAQHFIAVIEDITAQRDAETRFARVLDTTAEAVITIDSSQQIILFNQSAENIFAYTQEEALGQTLDMLLPDYVISNHHQYVDAFANGQDIARGMGQRSTDLFARRKDGHVFPIEASISKLTEGDDVILTVFIRDVSEQKEAAEALRESEGRYHRIIDNMLEGFQIINFNWEYLYVNQSAADHGRLSKHELLGHSMMEKYPGIETTEMFAVLKRCMEERVAQHAEFEFVYPDHSSAWFELSVQSVPEGIFVLSLPISERKEAEQAMQELNEVLEQRVLERTAHLEAVNKELEAFSYSVSHDLRAPLRALDGFSQAIVEDYREVLDEDGQEYLDLIRFESQRMGQLIDDLIDLSRFTRTDLHREWLDLSAIAQEISQKLRAQDRQRDGDFIIQTDLMICADARLMRVVLENLLGNAWKYTGKASRYRIEFGSKEENAEIIYFVRDNGAGFDMAYVHKLFGAFQRLHAASDYEGTGIGLATVQRIIRRHGGQIRAEGLVNEGASFYFSIGQGQCEG